MLSNTRESANLQLYEMKIDCAVTPYKATELKLNLIINGVKFTVNQMIYCDRLKSISLFQR